jgi:hypothetical protein
MPRNQLLGGDAQTGSTMSTDYGDGVNESPASPISNVQIKSADTPWAHASKTFGRKNRMWTFSDPLGQGSFQKDDAPVAEIPPSDPGSGYARNRG